MGRLLVKRLLQLLAVCWGVGTLTFVMMRALPGDVAYRIAASRYGMDAVDARAAELVREELGLDAGAWDAYWQWLVDLASLDLGTSLVSGLPVVGEIWHMLGHSLVLAAAGVVLSALIAIPVGTASAFRGGWLDQLTLVLSTGIRAVPVFVIGLIAVMIFALNLNWLPVAGFGEPKHLILPAMTLAVSLAAISSRVIRNETIRVINAPYYEFAQTKGLSARRTFLRHGVRNLSAPVVAFFGVQMITVVESMVMIESLFSWPGIGHGLAHAVFGRDIPVIQGAALAMGALFVIINTLVDVTCHFLDPRGRAIS